MTVELPPKMDEGQLILFCNTNKWRAQRVEIAHLCNVHGDLMKALAKAVQVLRISGHDALAAELLGVLSKAEGRTEAPTHKRAEWSNDLGYCRYSTCTEVSDPEAQS